MATQTEPGFDLHDVHESLFLDEWRYFEDFGPELGAFTDYFASDQYQLGDFLDEW